MYKNKVQSASKVIIHFYFESFPKLLSYSPSQVHNSCNLFDTISVSLIVNQEHTDILFHFLAFFSQNNFEFVLPLVKFD